MVLSGRFLLPVLGALLMSVSTQAANTGNNILSHTVRSIDGQSVTMDKYKGKVVLIVNVASQCGLTPQYTGLQKMYEKYKDKGLVVLGFPCNQFGGQEPGTNEEIQKFCSSKYHVTFDMFDKVDVNGDGAAPLYQQLTGLDAQPKGAGKVRWNFEKFLVNRQGDVIGRFDPKITPENQDLVSLIEKALAE
jgi:glutathione peroxidase